MGVRDALDYIALVVQLSGLDAVMLITLAVHLLRIPQCEVECSKLEACACKLRTLLRRGGDVATQLAAGALVEEDGALGETDILLHSYRGSSLWCLIRTGKSMLAQLRGMQDRVNSLCQRVLRVHANLPTDHPQSDTNNAMNHHVFGDTLHGAENCDSASESKTSDSTGQGGADDQSDNTEPGEFESAV